MPIQVKCRLIAIIYINNLALSFNGRHYQDRADYVRLHNLTKDDLMQDETTYNQNHDFTNTLKTDQWNTVLLKVLYYFDYLYLRKKSMSNWRLNDR